MNDNLNDKMILQMQSVNKYKNINNDKYKDEILDVDLKTLIINALEYYDTNMEKYEHIFDNLHYEIKYPENNYGYLKLEFYNDKNEFQFESKFEMFGEYFIDKKMWIWSWATTKMKQNSTNVSRQLWIYGSKLASENKFLRLLLTTSRFTISNIKHIDTHLAISAYLTKTIFLYRLYLYDGKISYSNYGGLNNNYNKEIVKVLYIKLIDQENIMEYIQKKK
jgi:hypothetical protein